MRRYMQCAVAVLIIAGIAEHRLSDGELQSGPADPSPELWEEAEHAHEPFTRAVEARSARRDCPILTSLDRDSRYRLTSIEDGVPFDIDADGDLEQVSWTHAESDVAFLALDSNGDGRITSGRELISGRTSPGARDGLDALIALANDGGKRERRGTIDSDHPLLFRMLLWTDANHNGMSEADELQPAHEVLSAVGLGYWRYHRIDQHGNESHYRGFVHIRTEAGRNTATSAEEEIRRRRPMYAVCLVSR